MSTSSSCRSATVHLRTHGFFFGRSWLPGLAPLIGLSVLPLGEAGGAPEAASSVEVVDAPLSAAGSGGFGLSATGFCGFGLSAADFWAAAFCGGFFCWGLRWPCGFF